MKTIITDSMFAAGIIILLLLCFYAYVWRPHGQTMYLRGRNDAINSVLMQLQQRKEVAIKTTNGEIILVPKVDKISNE